MDETEDASPFVSNAEVEINQVLGLFDVPAFARRGKELEYALSRLSQRLGREREGMLDMVKVRLREWSGRRDRSRRLARHVRPAHRPALEPGSPRSSVVVVEASVAETPKSRRGRPGRERRAVQPPLG